MDGPSGESADAEKTSTETTVATAPCGGGELVVLGATGRRLLFEPEELVLPERLRSSPRAPWFQKQWEDIKPVWIEWVRRDERGLMHCSLEELTEKMAQALERRAAGKSKSKKKYHQRKRAEVVEAHMRALLAEGARDNSGGCAAAQQQVIVIHNFVDPRAFVAMERRDRDALIADVLGGVHGLVAAAHVGDPADRVRQAIEAINATPYISLAVADHISAAEWEAREASSRAAGAAPQRDTNGSDSEHSGGGDAKSDDSGVQPKKQRRRPEHYRRHYRSSAEIDVANGLVCVIVRFESAADAAAVRHGLHGRVFDGHHVVSIPYEPPRGSSGAGGDSGVADKAEATREN